MCLCRGRSAHPRRLSVLGVPNMSADFSAAKALLSSQRQGMLPDTVARKLFLMANRRLWQANPGVPLPQ